MVRSRTENSPVHQHFLLPSGGAGLTGLAGPLWRYAMNVTGGYQSIDLVVVALANLMNTIMVVVFVLRSLAVGRLQVLGVVWVVMVMVLAYVVTANARGKREWWTTVLPALLLVFLLAEVALDYVARYEFRSTALLGPYLFLYYISILGMIGYAFLTEKTYGYVTLATYFLSQIAALYSYFKVGHG